MADILALSNVLYTATISRDKPSWANTMVNISSLLLLLFNDCMFARKGSISK